MIRLILIVVFMLSSAFAQEMPEYLHGILEKSQDYFLTYSKKSNSQIEDGNYDESEYLLFAQIDQINTFDVVFSKEEIRAFKVKIVVAISQIFDESQLQAIVNVGNSSELNKKRAARFFEVAQEYKRGNLKENRICSVLAQKNTNSP